MTNEELNTALYEKLFAEQQDFKGWLVKQPPEEILKHAYECLRRLRCENEAASFFQHKERQGVFHL